MISITQKIFLIMMLMSQQVAWAEMAISQSRVVMHHSDREAVVYLKNTGTYPVMVQSWVDDGKVENVPQQAYAAPILTLPALLSLSAGDLKAIRLVNKFEQQNRELESLYWLNIYELMPSPDTQASEVVVNVNARMQFKVFYRPDSLTLNLDKVEKLLLFQQDVFDKQLTITNASAFYLSFSHLSQGEKPLLMGPLMIAPKSQAILTLPEQMNRLDRVQFGLIDDDGVVRDFQATVRVP